MGNRVGLARTQALIQGLKRELTLSTGTSITVGEIKSTTGINTTAQMEAGTGIAIVPTAARHSVVKVGNVFHTTIVLDLAGLESAGSADKIIGNATDANATIGQITTAVNGTIMAGRVTCLETPTTGEDDIDLYSSTAATCSSGDVAAGMTGLVALMEAGQNWIGTLSANQFNVSGIATVPAADSYLYLVSSGGNSAGTYGTGKFLIELWGY